MKMISRTILITALVVLLLQPGYPAAAAEIAEDASDPAAAAEIAGETEETGDDNTETGTCGENVTYVLDTSTGVLTISGTGEISGYIYGQSPFHQDERIKEVVIEEGVTGIGTGAFMACRNLTKATLPKSLTYIHSIAFSNCHNMKDFYVTSLESWLNLTYENTSNAWGEEYHLFVNETEISEITIPESITNIRNCAFYGFVNLKKVTIPDSVKSIGDFAFYGCSRLSDITIPEGLESIGERAFRKCSGLARITLPDSVTSIGHGCFWDCIRFRSFTIPSGMTSIPGAMFEDCTRLSSVSMCDGITSIGGNAFEGCSSLEKITLPEGVTEIGDHAFSGCINMTDINFPESLDYIGTGAFMSCRALKSVTFPERMSDIGQYAFSNSGISDSIVLPNGLTEIPYRAFEYCPLTGIAIPEGVTTIADSAFTGCNNLTAITIPASLESIEYESFCNCSKLKNIHIVSIEDWLKLHEQERMLYWSKECHLFVDGTEITEAVVPDSLEVLDTYSFAYCINLQNVILPDGLMSIGKNAFYRCISLERIDFPETVTMINECAFYSCKSLTSVLIPDQVEQIERFTFEGCDSMREVYIPVSVRDIDNGAFDVKESVAVLYGGTVEQWEDIIIGDRNNFADPIQFSEGIILSTSSLTLPTGQGMQLVYRVVPSEFSGSVSWTSSNPKVAAVDTNGYITALTYGKAVISAEVKSGNSAYKKTCVVQTRYYDVADSSKYYFTPVYWAADHSITNGYGNVYFGTDENCTREQMITFLWRQVGKPSSKLKIAPFADMDDSNVYYYKAVLWAYEKGITKGYSSGEYAGMFGIGLPVTREDTVTFIYRMAGTPAVSDADLNTYSFPDAESGKYYRKPITWAAKNGITKGYSSGEYAGLFGVGLNVLRQDIVTFLYRYSRL